ncbi:hypothetical protein G3I59_25145 [Amycolatopsis rubida]|uniref:Uncharacterized protein n=1 Tax=Amycolatopsis rubida TaxID=112413 RepID=A0ABX0C160_9PSEU|nr:MULTISPECIES: hypothetical protein [Amycolatopsis]MYW93806.1 hypothetical protein [Amycolatopsis rubida]NEC58796.1 hypothetical protein [Amycolatopsis rubida]OAP22997.1 hypothetical protein A4R44_06459 [Amycolatopsis sp. M39]
MPPDLLVAADRVIDIERTGDEAADRTESAVAAMESAVQAFWGAVVGDRPE